MRSSWSLLDSVCQTGTKWHGMTFELLVTETDWMYLFNTGQIPSQNWDHACGQPVLWHPLWWWVWDPIKMQSNVVALLNSLVLIHTSLSQLYLKASICLEMGKIILSGLLYSKVSSELLLKELLQVLRPPMKAWVDHVCSGKVNWTQTSHEKGLSQVCVPHLAHTPWVWLKHTFGIFSTTGIICIQSHSDTIRENPHCWIVVKPVNLCIRIINWWIWMPRYVSFTFNCCFNLCLVNLQSIKSAVSSFSVTFEQY